MHILSWWNPPSGAVEMTTVTSALVLLWKCSFSLSRLVCVLSQKEVFIALFPFASPFLWRPLVFCMPCLVRLSLISFLNGTTNYAISSRTLWTVFGRQRQARKQSAQRPGWRLTLTCKPVAPPSVYVHGVCMCIGRVGQRQRQLSP